MERRSFLKWATNGLGALFGAVLGVPAVAYVLDPRNRTNPAGDFKPVARLDDLTVGEPYQVAIRDRRRDAWTLHPNDLVGRVWLVRREDDSVDAFTTICPHLGCSVNFRADENEFLCPCHNGAFSLVGDLISEEKLGRPNPPPRGMDKLEMEIVDGSIRVKYENFIQGRHDKVRKT